MFYPPIHISVSESADIMVDGMAFRANFVQRTMHQGQNPPSLLPNSPLHSCITRECPMFRWMSVLLVFLPMMAESSPVHPPELGIQAPDALSGTIHVDPDRPTAGKRFRGCSSKWSQNPRGLQYTPSGHSLMDRQSLFPVRSTCRKAKRFKPHWPHSSSHDRTIPMRLRTMSALGPRPSALVPHLGARGTGRWPTKRGGSFVLGNAVPNPQPRRWTLTQGRSPSAPTTYNGLHSAHHVGAKSMGKWS